jgi:DNA (cytosine-5)-methyltransferase 1
MLPTDEVFLRTKKRPDYGGSRAVRVVDLFSGCGGATLGIAEASRAHGRGTTIVLGMENDERIRQVFDSNFRSIIRTDRGDVEDRFSMRLGGRLRASERATVREAGRIDLLVGGPPCQGNSDLNNHTRRDDPKNELYMVMVRAAEVLAPEHIIIENVPGVRRDSGQVLARAVEALSRLRYHVDEDLVRVARLGVPQLRVRHVLIASITSAVSVSRAVERSAVASPRTLRWAIGDLKAQDRNGDLMDAVPRLSRDNLRRYRFLVRNRRYDLPNWMRPPCHRYEPDHSYKSMYGRLRWTLPAQTITTGFGSPGQGRYFHPKSPRVLTPREAARVQFFPDWFDFSEAPSRDVVARCIGNAVPSKLAFALASELLF